MNNKENMLIVYNKLIEQIKSRIFSQRDVNVALSLAQIYGTFRWMNDDGVYFDTDVENFIISLVKQSPKLKVKKQKQHQSSATLLVSELYDFGGHSKVVLTWLKLMSSKNDIKHKIAVTRSITEKNKQKIQNYNVQIQICKNDGIDAINEIINYALGSKFVILHIHPDDIIATAAAKILSEFGSKIIFYNHADYAFSYGIKQSDIVCEIGDFGEIISKRTNRVQGVSFRLGIPIRNKKIIHRDDNKINKQNNKKYKIITCGSDWKYEPKNGIFFGDFIDKLLSYEKNVEFIIIGPSGKEKWWYKIKEKYSDHLFFHGFVSYEKYFELLKDADIYVDSFPGHGATAFPEALVSGLLCIRLSTPVQGYSFADQLQVDTIDHLVNKVLAFINRDKNEIMKVELIRRKVIEEYSESKFKERIEQIYNNTFSKKNVINNFKLTKKIDTYFFEKEWREKGKINIPPRVWVHVTSQLTTDTRRHTQTSPAVPPTST